MPTLQSFTGALNRCRRELNKTNPARRKMDAHSPRSRAARDKRVNASPGRKMNSRQAQLNTTSPCSAPCGLFCSKSLQQAGSLPCEGSLHHGTLPGMRGLASPLHLHTGVLSPPPPSVQLSVSPERILILSRIDQGPLAWVLTPVLLLAPQSHKGTESCQQQVSLEAGPFPVKPVMRPPALTNTWTGLPVRVRGRGGAA